MAKIFLHDSSGHPFQVQLSRELAGRGHNVLHSYMADMQTPRGQLSLSATDPQTLRIEGMDLGKPFPKYSYLKRILYERAFGRKLAKQLSYEKPDVFIASNMSPDRLAPVRAACKRLQIPLVFWVQDIYCNAIRQHFDGRFLGLGRLAGLFYDWSERRLLGYADHAVLITEDFIPFANSAGLKKEAISVIHNWAPLAELPVKNRHNDWATQQDLNGKFVFLYSGTLGLKHNPEHLAQLCEHFKQEPKVAVVVISEGLGADWLADAKHKRGLDNLRILPFQDFDRLPDVLASADVLLTLLETSAGVFSVPSKILTYMCATRPILMAGPSVNLGARLLTEHQAGLICPAEEPKKFCEQASTLYADSALREQLARNARHFAEQNFDITTIGDRFEAIVAEVVKGKTVK